MHFDLTLTWHCTCALFFKIYCQLYFFTADVFFIKSTAGFFHFKAYRCLRFAAGKILTFGAWCVRDYGFDYRDVSRHGGIVYFPISDGDSLKWRKNPAYIGVELIEKEARTWDDFDLEAGEPIYTQFQKDRDRFMFVADPRRYQNIWKGFEP